MKTKKRKKKLAAMSWATSIPAGEYGKQWNEDTKLATLGKWMVNGKYLVTLEARSHPTGEYLHLGWDIRSPLTPEDRKQFWNVVAPEIDHQLEDYFAQTYPASGNRRTT